MLTNLDAQYLANLAKGFHDEETAARLLKIAENLQGLDEQLANLLAQPRPFAPNDFDAGYSTAYLRIQGRGNVRQEGRTMDSRSAEIIARAIGQGKLTTIPLGKRTINPVTGKTFAEEAATEAAKLANPPKAKPKAAAKPSILDKIEIDLSDIDL